MDDYPLHSDAIHTIHVFSKATLNGDLLLGLVMQDAARVSILDVGTTCLDNPQTIVLRPNQRIVGVVFKRWRGTGVLIDFQFMLENKIN